MKKILIFGFPHSGTTILKSIIAHIDKVEEIINETKIVNETKLVRKNTEPEYIVGKWPHTLKKFFSKSYEDHIKIFIIRNPVYVFSSMNKRFKSKIPDGHYFHNYLETIKLFIKYRDNPCKNIYTIRYEELFENDYQQLRNLLDNIGLKYNDEIFNNHKFTNLSHNGTQLPINKPSNSNHRKYRCWQINQEFVSNNDVSKIELTKEQKQQIINNRDILSIYPDVVDLC